MKRSDVTKAAGRAYDDVKARIKRAGAALKSIEVKKNIKPAILGTAATLAGLSVLSAHSAANTARVERNAFRRGVRRGISKA